MESIQHEIPGWNNTMKVLKLRTFRGNGKIHEKSKCDGGIEVETSVVGAPRTDPSMWSTELGFGLDRLCFWL